MQLPEFSKELLPADWHRLVDKAGIEWVGGNLVEKPSSLETSDVAVWIHTSIHRSTIDRGIRVIDARFGYRLSDALVYKPSLTVVRANRFHADSSQPFSTIPPDLAIEVIAAGWNAWSLESRIRDYLDHGFGAVWIIYPHTKTVYAHTLKDVRRFGVNDEIDGGEALPGLRCKVADFFA